MDDRALQPRVYPKSRSFYTSEILWQAEKLGVPSETLHGKDLNEFKVIIKQAYRKYLKLHHPDVNRKGRGRGAYYGSTKSFSQKTKIYEQLMALREEDIIRQKKITATVAEIQNPWSIWRMPLDMPYGQQESFDHLNY